MKIKSCENVKICYIFNDNFENKYIKDTEIRKLKGHYHYTGDQKGAVHSICNLKDNIPKEIPIVFHNGSNYDYHFITK